MVFLLPFAEFLNEKLDLSDIEIDVSNKNEMIDKLISGLSILARKRKVKNFRINKVSGFLHDGEKYKVNKNRLTILMNNGDKIVARNVSGDDESTDITINGDLVYDIDWKMNQEEFVDKIISLYKEHLKKSKFKI